MLCVMIPNNQSNIGLIDCISYSILTWFYKILYQMIGLRLFSDGNLFVCFILLKLFINGEYNLFWK